MAILQVNLGQLILIFPIPLWPPIQMHTSIHFFPRTIRDWYALDTLARSNGHYSITTLILLLNLLQFFYSYTTYTMIVS